MELLNKDIEWIEYFQLIWRISDSAPENQLPYIDLATVVVFS